MEKDGGMFWGPKAIDEDVVLAHAIIWIISILLLSLSFISNYIDTSNVYMPI